MTTPPLWDFQLTPEQGLKIALVSTNWAMVDNHLGATLEFLAGITDRKVGAELIHAVDLRKKIQILDSRRKQGRMPDGTGDLVQDMVWAGEKFYADRNMLAHGIIGGSAPDAQIVWSQSRLKALDLTHLDAVLGEAQYAAHIAYHLFVRCQGVVALQGPPPPRPPVRAAQP